MTFGESIEDGYAAPAYHFSIILHLHRVFIGGNTASAPHIGLPDSAVAITANCREEATVEVMVRTREWLDSQGVISDRLRGVSTVCRGLLAAGLLTVVPPEEYPCLEVAELPGGDGGLAVRIVQALVRR